VVLLYLLVYAAGVVQNAKILPSRHLAYAGESKVLACEASSQPVWSKDAGKTFNFKYLQYYNGIQEVIEVQNLQNEDNGYYHCTDSAREYTDSMYVYVGG